MLLGKLSSAHSDVYFISMQRGKLIGRLSKNGELTVEQGDFHASFWMHSMYSLQPPKDPKTSRTPSHPGAVLHSPGAQCCSVLNYHNGTDTARNCIWVTSTCHQHRAGLPAPASSRLGWLGKWTVCVGQLFKRQDTCQSRKAGSHPAQVATVLHLYSSLQGLCKGTAFTQGW